MSIMDKLKKNSKIKATAVLEDSVFFQEKDIVIFSKRGSDPNCIEIFSVDIMIR